MHSMQALNPNETACYGWVRLQAPGIDTMEYHWIACLLGVCAAILMGFSKTGLPGAATPAVALMAAAFPDNAGLSVGAMLPVLLIGDVIAVRRFGREAMWGPLLGLFPYVVLGMLPAYLVLWWLNGNQMRSVVGGLVLALVLLELMRQRLGWTQMPKRRWFTAMAGFLAGFCTTVANAGGPVMIIYLLNRGLLKEQFVGTCAWFFFILNLSKVVPFTMQGMLTTQSLTFGLALGPMTIAGALVGAWFLGRISQKSFNALMLVLAGLAGLWLVMA